MEFVIITGISGAGKSQAVKCMEDQGYYCIDNLPPTLINDFINLSFINGGAIAKAAFVIDIRGGEFFDALQNSIKEMKDQGKNFKVLFLEASNEVLIRRYKETRREHPLRKGGSVEAGIQAERQKLAEIRKLSDYIIDTTHLKNAQLKEEIRKLFSNDSGRENLSIHLVSFGFKSGIPLDADMVYDVRFIPNPFYLKSMKKLTGNNKRVRDYVMRWEESQTFVHKTHELITYLMPYYMREGKSSLVVAFGCTGGQHRSVTIANTFYDIFSSEGKQVTVSHRDL